MPETALVFPADIDTYRADGVVCLRGAFAPEWLDLLAAGVERNLAAPGPTAQHYTKGGPADDGFFLADHAMWREIPEYHDFIMGSPAAAIAGTLMDATEVNIFFDNLILKNPRTPNRTPWHQDVPYWPIEGEDVMSLWLPLDPVARECGMEFIRGSHLWDASYKPKSFYDPEPDYDPRPEVLAATPDFDRLRDEHEILSWALQPGDVLAFDGHVTHGARGNSGAGRRRAFVTRWAGDRASYAIRPGHMHPTFPNCGLAHGDALECDTFPVIWRRGNST
jgi:ectoine hydroxylase-related dioxygenase (phytanoyl-CoA dioxygenase family)